MSIEGRRKGVQLISEEEISLTLMDQRSGASSPFNKERILSDIGVVPSNNARTKRS